MECIADRATSCDFFVISHEEKGERLDKVLKNRYPPFSRTYFQFLIEEGAILVGGDIVKKRTILYPGDEIEINFILTPAIDLTPQNIPLDILFEDDHLLAINKPSGLVVHPAPGHYRDTFVNALLYHCKGNDFLKEDLRPGIVHRLDKDTTGVLLAAKTRQAHQLLIEQFANRSIHKTYFAFCVGNPGNCTIDAPLARHPTKRKEMAVIPFKGKEAITLCKTLRYNDKIAFVELQLITGRTHQIRVHLQHICTPVLGDPIYGSHSANHLWNIHSQLLHAAQITLLHPVTKIPLLITAPLPSRMESILKLMD